MASASSVHTIDKVVLITGAASGFGAASAKALARDGAKVVISDINEEGGEAVAAEINDSGVPGKAVFIKANVTSAEDWKNLLAGTLQAFGKIDVVVNNGKTVYQVFAINVSSVFHSVATIIPHMIKQGTGGVFLAISSISAIRPRPGLAWYAATKGAVTTASKGFAVEYAPHNIRFNTISPVLSETGLTAQFTGLESNVENNAKFLSNIPLGRLGQPEDIAEAVVWLSSEKAKFITGTDTWVDGGRAV